MREMSSHVHRIKTNELIWPQIFEIDPRAFPPEPPDYMANIKIVTFC